MNGVTKAKWNQMDELGNNLCNYAKNDIKNQIEYIQNLRKQVNWEGAASETALMGFDKYMSDMQIIAQAIAQYGEFMKAAAEKYKGSDQAIGNMFENEVFQRRA